MKRIIFKKLKKQFIIAEKSENHYGSLSKEIKMKENAKNSGYKAIKIKTNNQTQSIFS